MSSPAFVLIGCGHVVEKYWVPAHTRGLLCISGVFSVEPVPQCISQLDQVPYFQIPFDLESSVLVIDNFVRIHKSAHVAILTPTALSLTYLKALLKHLPDTVDFYLEKPYSLNVEGVQELGELLHSYGSRIHLANQYGSGRAHTLYPHLPKQLPRQITSRLLEGQEYLDDIKANRAFLANGPELDLGFHLMTVIYHCLLPFNPSTITIESNQKMGVSQSLLAGFSMNGSIETSHGEVPFSIIAGKGVEKTQKYIELHYDGYRIVQDFIRTNDCLDRVLKISDGDHELLACQDLEYNYYCHDLTDVGYCKQPLSEQLALLRCVTAMCECGEVPESHKLREEIVGSAK